MSDKPISDKLPAGVVNIKGKQYETVALRVSKFRDKHPDYRLITEIIERSDALVVMRATVQNQAGEILATGHAEEYRKASEINRTSALENCETSAIGRALASFGLGGTEFASADEVSRAISGAKGAAPVISPVRSAQGEPVDDGQLADLATAFEELLAQEPSGAREEAIWRLYKPLDSEMRLALWNHWQDASKLRNTLKRIVEVRRQMEAEQAKVAA